MMLTKEIVTGSIEIFQDLNMNVREDTIVLEDGVELSRTFFRYSLIPGDDVSTRPQLVKDITALLWTPEAIQSWKDKHPNDPLPTA
jgi:hypothetical protein